MKKSWVWVTVASVHIVAVLAVLMIQGCRTLSTTTGPSEPVMPPTRVVEEDATTMLPPTRPAPEWPAETTTYVVGKGESLSTIAHRYGLSTDELAALNGIANKNLIRAGQKLTLPGKIDLGKTRPATSTPRVARPAGAAEYVVKKGDSLSVIAHRQGTTVKAIKAANGLTGDMIRVGQKLFIPGGQAPRTAPRPATPVVDGPVEQDPPAPAPAPQVTPPAPAPDAPVAGPTTSHTVEANEDLYTVAMMYGVAVSRLKEINGLADTKLEVGQVLKIPAD